VDYSVDCVIILNNLFVFLSSVGELAGREGMGEVQQSG